MKSSIVKFCLVGMTIASGLALAGQAQATIITTATQTPTFDPTDFNNPGGGYSFNNLSLPAGTSIGTTVLQIDIPLSSSITLTSVGMGYNYGFGMGGLDPEIQPGGEAFSFYIQLLNNGSAITPSYAYLMANPYTFGFTEPNPFGVPENNLYVTTGTGSLASSLTFNEIDIQVFNYSQTEAADSFGVSLGVNEPLNAVPEPTTLISGALMLLPFGSSVARRLRKKFQAA